jgi:hypothetical protein
MHMSQSTTENKKTQTPRSFPSEKPHRDLTSIQAEIADLATQLIVSGGMQADVMPFLSALYRHQYRNTTFCQDDAEETIKSRAASRAECCLRDLVRQWPQRAEKPTDEETTPTTVKDIVQTDLRNRLAEHFEEFVRDHADLESIWLLNEVLEWYTSDSIDLAEAFARMIDSDKTYVPVPWPQAKKLREVAKLLVEVPKQ